MMQAWNVVLAMDSYIADPYWPELEEKITLEKKSGMNFQRSDAKRDATLLAYLEQQGMTMDDYRALAEKAARPWYRIDDEDASSEIVIPRHQMSGALVQTCKVSPSSVIKKSWAENLRSMLRISPMCTGKVKADRVWKRYVKGDQSNQRRLHSNEVIESFAAAGSVSFDPDVLKPATVEALFRYVLVHVGIGACRKMGFGRGSLAELTEDR